MFDTGKPLQMCYRTVSPIGPILKLRRNWSVVNTVPGAVFHNTSFFLLLMNAHNKRERSSLESHFA